MQKRGRKPTEAVSFLIWWWLRNSCKGKAVVEIDLLMNMIGQEKNQKTSLKNIIYLDDLDFYSFLMVKI